MNFQIAATRNTEYHLRDRVCIAVRDRRTGRWHSDHPAVGNLVTCMFASVRGGWRPHAFSTRRIGSVMHFGQAPEPVTTGAIRVVFEPDASVVAFYQEHAA